MKTKSRNPWRARQGVSCLKAWSGKGTAVGRSGSVLRSGAVESREFEEIGNLLRCVTQGLHLDRPRHVNVSEGRPQRY